MLLNDVLRTQSEYVIGLIHIQHVEIEYVPTINSMGRFVPMCCVYRAIESLI